jgi:hypothetical protein
VLLGLCLSFSSLLVVVGATSPFLVQQWLVLGGISTGTVCCSSCSRCSWLQVLVCRWFLGFAYGKGFISPDNGSLGQQQGGVVW